MIKMVLLSKLNLKDEVWYEGSVIINPTDTQVVDAVRIRLSQLEAAHNYDPEMEPEVRLPQSERDLGLPRTFAERVADEIYSVREMISRGDYVVYLDLEVPDPKDILDAYRRAKRGEERIFE